MLTRNGWQRPIFFRPFFDALEDVVQPMNVTHDEEHFFVRAELPGIQREDIEISTLGNRLTVAGKGFRRTFALPQPFDADRIEAKYELGILTVVLPKTAEAKPRKIAVKGSGS
jgi:HSP20 family protein